jgi:hypothetical protein
MIRDHRLGGWFDWNQIEAMPLPVRRPREPRQ